MESNVITTSITTSAPPRKGKHHGRSRPKDHIPRSPNAFLLYRSDFLKKGIIPPNVESNQQTLSHIIAKCWKRLNPEELKVWNDLANKKKLEHAVRHPGYHYQPYPPRTSIKRRRQSYTREEIIRKCDELMERFIPDKAGPVPSLKASLPRKRNSRPKPRPSCHVAKDPSEPKIRVSSSSQEEPVFMDPLLRPSSTHIAEQPLMSATAHQKAATVVQPFILYNVPQEQEWLVESPPRSPTPSAQSPVEVVEPSESPLNVVTHIRAEYQRTLRSSTGTTAASDVLEAQSIFEPQPFCVAPCPTQEVQATIQHSSPPVLHDELSYTVCSSGSSFQQVVYQPPPLPNCNTFPHTQTSGNYPEMAISYPEAEQASPLNTTSSPHHFPMTVEAHVHLNGLQLQAPVFDSHDSLLDFCFQTYPLDNTNLAQLTGNFAVASDSTLFGEGLELGLGSSHAASDWLMAPMGDLLQINTSPTGE